MYKILIIVVSFGWLAASTVSFGQSIMWQRLYTSPWKTYNYCKDLCQATNNNFYAVGSTRDSTTANYYVYVLKLNPYGDTIWTRIIDSVSADARSCAPSGDGGVVIVGEGHFALKLDSSGNIAWKRFYGSGGINCYDIIRKSDGGFIACGDQLNFSTSGFHYDSYVMKLDFNGNMVWESAYLALFDKPLKAVLEINGEGYVFTGYVTNFPTDTTRCIFMKIGYLGNVILDKNYKILDRTAVGISISEIIGGMLIGGGTRDSTLTFGSTFLMKVDNIGTKYFEKVISSNQNEIPQNCQVLNNVRYAITIYKDIAKNIITDSVGNVIYEKSYPTQYFSIFQSILPQSNGDIIFGGTGRITGFTVYGYVIRTDSMLNSPHIGLRNTQNEFSSDYILYQNYPNPFNPDTKIRFYIAKSGLVNISIYNVLGEKVSVLVDKELHPGDYIQRFTGNEFASGIYFYMLSINGQVYDTKKMALLK